MNYATIDKELLCVITTLQELCSMLLGAELHIHTDHKNILNVGDSCERCLQWISYVDEYSPTLHYMEGPCNVIADIFSRLLHQDDTSALVRKKASLQTVNWLVTLCLMTRRSLTVLKNYQVLFLARRESISFPRNIVEVTMDQLRINATYIFLKIW
jgi:hypothetical protein